MSTQTYNPTSTYRIQFNKEFRFSDLERILPYLKNLGIRTIYASPIFEATPGSMHGYDGTNPNAVNSEIGTEAELVRISAKLREMQIGWIQDIVPNHLAFNEYNHWLMDVLEKGRQSEFADFFDIDWDHPEFGGKLMVPFPGSSLEQKLTTGIPEGQYVVCDWRDTDKRINYRRFFTVNDLICTNIQQKNVFDAYHRFIRRCVEDNIFQGLRVDHIDGLQDPQTYLQELRDLAGPQTYIVVEKILEHNEPFPKSWPVQGNTGYDFLGIVNNLFTNKTSEKEFSDYYSSIVPGSTPVEQQITEKKANILFQHMGGELDNLLRLYKSCHPGHEDKKDDETLRQQIATYLINCPVYRYYGYDYPKMNDEDASDAEATHRFYTRCMQFSGPLMAKGVEDTLMYTYNRFIGHNDVGDGPDRFGLTAEDFHDLMEQRLADWPDTMNATSTHDTKRGEDARARLNVLTDISAEWFRLVRQWMNENNELRRNGMPDRNDEYFIYQTLIATLPPSFASASAGNTKTNESSEIAEYKNRLAEYLRKSLREAKIHSGWANPNETYEKATIDFAHSLLGEERFRRSFQNIFRTCVDFGMINSLSQLTLKLTCPGVPDIYQGTEWWDLSMVDPDNRRPVDYEQRAGMLQENAAVFSGWDSRHDGHIKLALLHKLLLCRSKYANIFSQGKYRPVRTKGAYAGNVLAFLREHADGNCLVVVPLHLASICEPSGDLRSVAWQDTAISLDSSSQKWHSVIDDSILTGDTLLVDDLFKSFPLAVFYSPKS